MLVGTLALPGPTTAVPAALAAATVQAATPFLAGKTVAGAVPAVILLAEGVLRTMSLNNLKHLAASLMATGMVSLGVVVLAAQGPGGNPQAAKPPGPARPEARPVSKTSPALPARPEASAKEVTRETLIDGLLARSTAVTSGRIEYRVKVVIAGGTVSDNDHRFSFSGESWAMRVPLLNLAVVNHDGRLLSYSSSSLEDNRVVGRSLRINFPESPFKNEPYPPVQAGTLWFPSTGRFVREQASKARLLGTETINGIETQGLEWDVDPKDKFLAFGPINSMLQYGGKLRLHVARQLGYALPRIECVDKFGTVQDRFDFSDFKEVAPGIFMPALCRLDGGSFNRTYQLKKIEKINEPIPDGDFVLSIPAATSVNDDRPKLNDKVGPDGKRTYSLKDYPFRSFQSGAAYPQGFPAELLKELDRGVIRVEF
jgi:hypothetical protein